MILALKLKVRKKLHIIVREKQQIANIVRSHIAQVTQKCKFPQRLR